MAHRLSRRLIAQHFVDQYLAGNKTVVRELAAYLVDTRRTREIDMLVRDIEDGLAQKGTVIATVSSAYPLSEAIKKEISSLVNASDLELREEIDTSLLGGLRIDLPGKRLDSTLRHRLNALKAKQL